MQAAVCRAFKSPLVIEDISLAPPEAGEIRVRIKACAICHSDLIYANGAWGDEPPLVFGHEAAGVVEEIGAGVDHVGIGDHVVVTLIRACGRCRCCDKGYYGSCETQAPIASRVTLRDSDGEPVNVGIHVGAFAEEVTVVASQAVAIDKDVPFASASLLGCGIITGLGAVTHTAKVPVGASVVVIGCGGVGLSAVQGARLCSADPIVAVDIHEAKLDDAKNFGAHFGVNANGDDFVDQILNLTDGRGADYVFVTVGSIAATNQAFSITAPGGDVVVVGMAGFGEMAQFEQITVADLSQRVLGSKMGHMNIHEEIPKLISLYKRGELLLDEMVSGTFPLGDINTAIAEVESGSVRRNVVVFD
ncbi:MAG: zinc-binding dehydrogenase [Pseudomonadota bacterium]